MAEKGMMDESQVVEVSFTTGSFLYRHQPFPKLLFAVADGSLSSGAMNAGSIKPKSDRGG